MKERKSSPNFQYTRACIVDTIYSLFIYLLISNKEETEHTFFFFSDGIAPSIRNKFPNHFYIRSQNFPQWNFFLRLWLRLKLRLIARLKWPFLSSADLYGHDHLCFTPSLTGTRKMTVLEDGLGNYCDNPLDFNPYSGIKLWIRNLLFGPLASQKPLGRSFFAQKVILTGIKEIPKELQQKTKLINLPLIWKELPEYEKERISDFFSIDLQLLKRLATRKIILITQPFTDIISTEEVINIYRGILKGINQSELIIKCHPRDTVDYQPAFPSAYIFNQPIPLELLTLLGVNFTDAYTISSTAIYLLPHTTKIHIAGHKVHPSLLQKYGNIT